jgi:dihydrofolate reductase
MRKLISFFHISLDGFVATPDGGLSWAYLDDAMFDFVGEMTNQADAALYGKNTYYMMDSYWPTAGDSPNASKHDREHAAFYNSVEKFVLSTTLQKQADKLTIISDHVSEKINQLKEQEGKNILMFGSPGAFQSLFNLGLIDELWFFVNPIVLSKGIALFSNVTLETKLSLKETKTFGSVIALHYAKV